MNYLPFAGYWFYGAASATERAAYFCSWGLLDVAPAGLLIAISVAMDYYRRLRG